MKELEWFPPIPEPRPRTRWWALAAALVADAWLCARGHLLSAVLLLCGTLVLFALSFSHVGEIWISRIARALARIVGATATWAFLLPFYVLAFGAARLLLAMARVDPLGLRLRPEQASYGQSIPPEAQRARYYQRLFTLEAPRRESRKLIRAIGTLAFVLLLAGSSEVILRVMGFGHPIIYRVDAQVGYYPAPDQNVHRYGGEIHINAFGMRSRDVAAQKPAGTFRILMLGDSTLYGGSYIGQNRIYAARLEKLLNARTAGGPPIPHPVEVLCLGVNAWGPQHELAYVTKFGIFQANLVMVMGPPDDAYRPRYGLEHLPFYAEGHAPHFAGQEFWDHARWTLAEWRRGSDAGLESGSDAGDVMTEGVNAWLKIAALTEAQGALVDFELLPREAEAREGKADDSTQQVLNALLPELARHRIPASFALAAFGGHLDSLKLYHDGAHLSAAGHVFYAVYLRNRVARVVSGR